MIKELKKKLTAKKKPPVPPKAGLSTGSTMLNLACSGKPAWGFAKGGYYFFVGDTNSGKTFLSLTCFAEATLREDFKDYRFIYDNVEEGAKMDMQKFFGKAVADRLEDPSPYGSSETIEDFYDNVEDALNGKKPFIYVLDSMDGLTSEAERKKELSNKRIRQRKKGKDVGSGNDEDETKGSYGDGKAKKNSTGVRQWIKRLEASGSIIIVISQTRDNIGFMAKFKPKTRSGGNALSFYAHVEIWSSVAKKLYRKINGKERQIGNLCRVHIKRTRFSGRETYVDIPIYWSSGVDDTGSMIDYLIGERHWKPAKGNDEDGKTVAAPEFDFSGSKEKLIQQIEEQGRERELRMLVVEVWRNVEAACTVQRKRRYA